MQKPSDEIKMIIEQVYSGKKEVEKIELGTADLYVIIQSVIYWLDKNASLAQEKRKAEIIITGENQCLPDILPRPQRRNADDRGNDHQKREAPFGN